MRLPRATFLNHVPVELHVSAEDADGVARDGVMVSAEFASDLSDYGIARHGYGDSVFMPAPFKVPPVKMALVKDGVRTLRRITGHSANPVFVQIDLGEDYG